MKAFNYTDPVDGNVGIAGRSDPNGDRTQAPYPPGTTSTRSTTAAGTTTATLLAANNFRLSASVYNNSDKYLYLALGASAASNSFTCKLSPKDYYELPYPVYAGSVTGVWEAGATGEAQVTEVI